MKFETQQNMITTKAFASDTHQSIMAEQFLIGTELENGQENREHSKT